MGKPRMTPEAHARYIRKHPEKRKARNAVWSAIHCNRLPRAKSLKCFDCGAPAKRYDHYLGYKPAYWLAVQPVCFQCCTNRERARGNDKYWNPHYKGV